jgi:hypothetical protein
MISFKQLLLLLILVLIFYPDWLPLYKIIKKKIKKFFNNKNIKV